VEIKKSNLYGIFTGAILGGFSNTAAVAMSFNTSLSAGSIQIEPSRDGIKESASSRVVGATRMNTVLPNHYCTVLSLYVPSTSSQIC